MAVSRVHRVRQPSLAIVPEIYCNNAAIAV